jgi:uncharacterized membrane protein YtjA (UPF0391 family)
MSNRLAWVVEGVLAASCALAILFSGVATTTAELARVLLIGSCAVLLVLLIAETRARRRWTLR